MPRPVFISYARDASRKHAEALYQALGADRCFLDTEDIAVGDPFPQRIVDALFDARVVVIFAEPVYFTRRYCLQELHVATTPFLRVADRPGATVREKEEVLRGIVLAMPPRGVDPMIDRFPPPVQERNWPAADQPDALAALVRAELAANPPTLRERYGALGDAEAERALHLAAAQLPSPLRIGSIPAVPALGAPVSIGDAFVGRADDIWRIHNVLTSRRGGTPAAAAGLTTSIEAGGGFGKTRLAVEYLYRFGTRGFRGGLFWIDAEREPEGQLYEVLQALDPHAPPVEVVRTGQGGVPGAVARALRRLPVDGDPALFVIDNVPEPAEGHQPEPLETWCPALGEVAVLTTSRTQVALGSGGAVIPIPLDTLDPEAAVHLLTRGLSAAGPLRPEEWREVAEWVGHLPLALELLNGALSSGALTPDDLLAASRSEQITKVLDDAMEALRGSVRHGALRGVSEAFSLSYERLSPEQQRAARLLAWMAPAPIPEAMLELDELGPATFSPATRAVLRTRSFVTPVAQGDGAFFAAMHRVLADFLLSQSPALDDEIRLITEAITRAVTAVKGTGDHGARRVRECAPAILAGFDRIAAVANNEARAEFAIGFGNALGREFSEWGIPEVAEVLIGNAWDLSERTWGAEHRNTLALMNNLASTLRARGNHAGAQALQERVLETARRTLGLEHSDTLASMNNLASTLRVQGDYAGAQALQERALEVQRRSLGEEHPNTIVMMNNLAATLSDRGYHAEAQLLQEHVLEVRRRTLGEEHPDTLISMNNLASTLRVQGDYAGAQALQERVLEARRRILGEEHPDTLVSMNNLASTLRIQGDYAGAQALQERGLEAQRRILGEEHPHTLVTMGNLALTLRAQGDQVGAQALQERVLEARERIQGEEHPDTLTAMSNLAVNLRVQGDHARTQALQQRVLEARRRVLGERHSDTTVSAWEYLFTLHRMADSKEASVVLHGLLLWLVEADPTSLTADQRKIREGVQQILTSIPERPDTVG